MSAIQRDSLPCANADATIFAQMLMSSHQQHRSTSCDIRIRKAAAVDEHPESERQQQQQTSKSRANCRSISQNAMDEEQQQQQHQQTPRPDVPPPSSLQCCRQRPMECRQRRRQQMMMIPLDFHRNVLALLLGLSMVASFSAQIPAVAGLACYETINGKTTIVQNDSWTYCALVPATIVGNELVNGSQFGLGPENDMLSAYNTAFSMNQEEYRILTVCIYERYDFSRFMTIKPDLAVEFAFRCVCNYDLCNSEPTFSAYLSAIKSESFAKR